MAELVFRALQQVWLALAALNLPAAVMGGIAVSLWRHVRATQDVDLLLAVRPEDEEDLIRALQAAGFRLKRDPPVLQLGAFRLLQLLFEPTGACMEVQVDLMLASSDYHRNALERRVAAALPDLETGVYVLACEDLILHKLLAGRLLDLADAAALLRANRRSLDLSYLLAWASTLGVEGDLHRVWQEALPGEALAPAKA